MSDSNQTSPTGRADPILAHPTAYTVALCVLWIVPGLFGHDPWKPDEAEVFGVVYHILQTGDWVVPTLAHEPFLETPPFFHITAALVAQALHGVMALHDAARLTSGLYMALTFLLVGLTARELIGPDRGWLAALALLGSLGLLVPAHLLLTDVAQLTGSHARRCMDCAVSLRRPVLGGIWLGTGAGLGFMSNGLLIFVSLAIAALLLPIVAPRGARGATWRPWLRVRGGAALGADLAHRVVLALRGVVSRVVVGEQPRPLSGRERAEHAGQARLLLAHAAMVRISDAGAGRLGRLGRAQPAAPGAGADPSPAGVAGDAGGAVARPISERGLRLAPPAAARDPRGAGPVPRCAAAAPTPSGGSRSCSARSWC